jgi:pilus assembly protein CpaE
VVADLDLAFLFLPRLQPDLQGIAEAVFSPGPIQRSSTAVIEMHRPFSAVAPATLDRVVDFRWEAAMRSSDTLHHDACIVLDVPPSMVRLTKRAIAPTISGRRGARSQSATQKPGRPARGLAAERPRADLLPQPGQRAGRHQRRRVREAIETPIAIIPFEPQLFGSANNGR